MLELQEDYRAYVSAVNKILHDYNKTKEKLDFLESEEKKGLVPKKKKEIDDVGRGFYSYDFPCDVKVFSSDDVMHFDEQDSLLLVNRDRDYLKESAISYFSKRGEKSLFLKINHDDWCSYTQYALSLDKPKKPTLKKKKVHRKRKLILCRSWYNLLCGYGRNLSFFRICRSIYTQYLSGRISYSYSRQ